MSLVLAPFAVNQHGNTLWLTCGESQMRITCDKLSVPMWHELSNEWWRVHFKKPSVIPCSFVTMVKTKELSGDMRSAIIYNHKTSKGYKARSKDLLSLFQQYTMLLRSVPSMELSRTSLDVGGGGRKIDERNLWRLVRMVLKTPRQTSKDLKANLSFSLGSWFQQVPYTAH